MKRSVLVVFTAIALTFLVGATVPAVTAAPQAGPKYKVTVFSGGKEVATYGATSRPNIRDGWAAFDAGGAEVMVSGTIIIERIRR